MAKRCMPLAVLGMEHQNKKEDFSMEYGKIAAIRDKLGEEELLTQLAVEATELAQAALKLRRAISGRNPTPKNRIECEEELEEELTDVQLCALLAQVEPNAPLMDVKVKRWYKRLTEGK